ncbi:hypothetical protein BKA65DRAFT_68914 [Rhexocercosporidium sp. MPI-PUGE-AT-0058]|nr:hypothetical protein BKA65DRAFT_68914 [Rhexocercosporidium sp. MPI-PUGE-AT-0058]
MADIKVEINQTIDPRMTTLDNSKPQRPTKLPQLGAPKWKDPERRQSIKYDSRVKMEWQLCTSLLAMNCWIALEPAKRCLNEAIQQIENLIIVKRNADVWDGEQTSPGCVWDRSMHGRSVKDAQPSVIFSSSSKICRRNAKRIIKEEKIVVDPRGIGIEYYETGPEFLAGFDDLEDGSSSHTSKDSRFKEKQSAGSLGLTPTHSNTLPPTPRPEPEDIKTKKAINGALVQIGNVTCTFGGFIFVGEELFGLTVAHPFDNKAGDLSTKPVKIKAPSTLVLPGLENPIGILNNKRALVRFDTIRRPDLDWSLCKVNGLLVHLTNKVFVPNGGITYPRRIPEEDPADKVVVVHSGRGGVVSGAIMADYSLVALPGRKSFQRMWIVVLERVVQKGDCGSWVIDPITEDWLGHIIAGKPGTRVAYMVLSRDIARSISDEMCGKPVRIPSEAEMEITAAVRDVKDSLFIPQNAFSTQAPSLSQYQAPGNATNGLQRATSEDYTPCVRERTISISSTNFSTFTPAQGKYGNCS